MKHTFPFVVAGALALLGSANTVAGGWLTDHSYEDYCSPNGKLADTFHVCFDGQPGWQNHINNDVSLWEGYKNADGTKVVIVEGSDSVIVTKHWQVSVTWMHTIPDDGQKCAFVTFKDPRVSGPVFRRYYDICQPGGKVIPLLAF